MTTPCREAFTLPQVFRSLPPATKLGQGYVFTGVCDSVHRGEYLTRYPPPRPGTPPGTRYPPGPGTPPRDQVPPQTRYTPPGTRYTPRTRYTPPGQIHPSGPGTPPGTRYTPPDQVHPPGTRYTPPGPGRYGLRAGGTHPTGMHSCFRSMLLERLFFHQGFLLFFCYFFLSKQSRIKLK